MEHLPRCSEFDPAKIFLTSIYKAKISQTYLLFSSPAHKTKTGTVNWWEATNAGTALISYLRHSSLADVIRLCCTFHQPQQSVLERWAKTIFAEPNQHVLNVLHPILVCRSYTEHGWSCSYGWIITTCVHHRIIFLSFNLIFKTFALDFPYWDGSLDLANYDQFVDLAKYDLRHMESQTTVVSGSSVLNSHNYDL